VVDKAYKLGYNIFVEIINMAIRNKSLSTGNVHIEALPKKTRQGQGNHTKYSATSRNHKKKAYRGQGR
tara:strand:- start:555 stop:758 length:204 start_codon:yes stop_codon:yes gene_type:complete